LQITNYKLGSPHPPSPSPKSRGGEISNNFLDYSPLQFGEGLSLPADPPAERAGTSAQAGGEG